MNVAGSWGLEFHIILEEERGGKRNRLRTRSLLAGWIDCFMKIKHIPDNLKKTFIRLKLPTQRFGPLLGVRNFYLLCLQEALDVCNRVFLWEQSLQVWKLCIKTSSCLAWFSCISLIGRGCFIISRCTPSIIRRHRSLGVTKISDDSQTGCYRL